MTTKLIPIHHMDSVLSITRIIILFFVSVLLIPSCKRHSSSVSHNSMLVIQPFNDITPSLVATVYKELKAIHPNTILRTATAMPPHSYYAARNRYRADSIIKHLATTAGGKDTVVIGLTSKDISTTIGNKTDWGVMGLGYRPGNACVASTFRLNKARLSEQFYKVAIHELGHTQGLPHCPVKTCFMRDAKGGNPLNEETHFCASCKSFLQNKGWRLN